jgi:hypothetical protein
MSNSKSGRLRWVLGILLVVIVFTLLALAWRGQAAAGTPAEEMLQFNHGKHVAAGVPCLFCHAGARSGPVAGIPSLAKCMGCHQNIQVTTLEGQSQVNILLEHWEKELPLRWPKVNDLPDFVYFSHRPHIAAGVACESCHGNVAEMAMARPAYRINMGFCLACHTPQGAEKQARLTSCATCHK